MTVDFADVDGYFCAQDAPGFGGLSMVDFSYAWVSSRPGVSSVLVGPVTLEHLDHAVKAIVAPLAEDASARVDAAYRAWLGTDTHYSR